MMIGFLYSRIRFEEKLLLQAAEKRGLAMEKMDERSLSFNVGKKKHKLDLVLDRTLGHTNKSYIVSLLEDEGIRTINAAETVRICGDKVLTSTRLRKAGIPTPQTRVAFDNETALAQIEEMGYPVVLKPATGSWGRLMAKLSDRHAAEAVLEHKNALQSPMHGVFYMQEYVDKPGRDIRVYAIGDTVPGAIYRHAQHWITNTARGGRAEKCPMTPELEELCLKAADVVGGGILSIDLMEHNGDLVVHEINHTTEFRNSIQTTGVDLPGLMMEYVKQEVKQ